jgi:hypothetical protein
MKVNNSDSPKSCAIKNSNDFGKIKKTDRFIFIGNE